MEDDRRGGTPDPWGALDRAFAFVRPVGRAAERLAAAALVGGAIVWWAVSRGDRDAVVLALLGVALALPPIALAAFGLGIRALVSLPRRLRDAPSGLRERAEQIRRRAGDVTRGGRGPLQRVGAAARLAWAVASSREVLEVLGPATVLITPSTVVVAAIGAVAAAFEVLAGAVALIWLAVA